MENLKNIVSKNIIHLRTNRKMTQLELGNALSYSDKAVSKWERGEAVPDAYVLLKISSVFNVSVDYLLSEHSEKELKAVTPYRSDRRIISLIAILGVWTLAITIFAVFWFTGSIPWLVFVYALPVSFVMMIIFITLWGNKKNNVYFISLLLWSIICVIYFTFLQYNWWFLFVIGLPAQIIVLLSFRIRKKAEKTGLS